MTEIAPPATSAATTTPRASAPPPASGAATAASTAQAFEAVFLGQMAQTMMATLDGDGDFSGGHGEEMFRGILAEQLGTTMAARGGIGLAPVVMDQIIKMQEGQ